MESLKKNSVKLANHWLSCQYSQPTDLPAKLPCRVCSPKASWSNGDQSTTTRCLTFVICFFCSEGWSIIFRSCWYLFRGQTPPFGNIHTYDTSGFTHLSIACFFATAHTANLRGWLEIFTWPKYVSPWGKGGTFWSLQCNVSIPQAFSGKPNDTEQGVRFVLVYSRWVIKLGPLTSGSSMQGVLSTNYMGVSKNRGTPKWMVYNGKPY